MDLGKKTTVFLLVISVYGVATTMAAVYKVGDDDGWTNVGHFDYKNWSATKNFHVGDVIVFEYNKEFHNVVRVTHRNFRSCNATAPYAISATGNYTFTIKRTGHFFFICSVPGHCQDGQKVDIRVPKPQAPAPAPVPSSPSSVHSTPSPGNLVPSQAPSPSPSNMSPHGRNSGTSIGCRVWISVAAALSMTLCVVGIGF